MKVYHNGNFAMGHEQVASIAPLSATGAYHQCSDKYQFISTLKILGTLADHGIAPYRVALAGTRIEDKKPYVRHEIRLRKAGQEALAKVGQVFPEVILRNAHDRGSSFVLSAGLYRLVCSNGLTVVSANFAEYKTRHVGNHEGEILEATYKILDQFPIIADRVAEYQGTILSPEKQYDFALRAMGLRWKREDFPFLPSRLLELRRLEDNQNDLWTVYNRIQENLVKGVSTSRSYVRRGHSRAIGSIDESKRINTSLWQMVEEFAQV